MDLDAALRSTETVPPQRSSAHHAPGHRRENQGLSGVSQKTYLTLSLAGPELPSLDLMDLPGLVTAREEPDTMVADTKALVDAAIRETGATPSTSCAGPPPRTRTCRPSSRS